MEVIKRWGAPDKETAGSINDLRVDLNTNDVYRCTGIKTGGEECGGAILYASGLGNTEYTWEACGSNAGADSNIIVPGQYVKTSEYSVLYGFGHVKSGTFQVLNEGSVYRVLYVNINAQSLIFSGETTAVAASDIEAGNVAELAGKIILSFNGLGQTVYVCDDGTDYHVYDNGGAGNIYIHIEKAV